MKLIKDNDNVFYSAETTSKSEIKRTDDAKPERPFEIVWFNVVVMALLHGVALYGLSLMFTSAKARTNILGNLATVVTILFLTYSTYSEVAFAIGFISTMGITGGAHRLWSHRSYKANLPLRILLAFLCTTTFQNDILEWCRDHRVHHKFAETDADPHNASRGFFFSHMGWLMVKKHPHVKEKGQLIDLSDLKRDGVVMFQKKYYYCLMPVCTFMLPALLPYYLCDETLWNSFFVCCVFRYLLAVHVVWCVNSVAHLYGPKPYDKHIGPTESWFLKWWFLGEGFHNYHHTFPWDYKAGELGFYGHNWTACMIDFFAWVGWATDLKKASREMVEKRVARTGDGSMRVLRRGILPESPNPVVGEQGFVWGWDDVQLSAEEKEGVSITNRMGS